MTLAGYESTGSIRIHQARERVFDFVSDPANDPTWRDSIASQERVEDACTGLACYRVIEASDDGPREQHLEVLLRSRPYTYQTRTTGDGVRASTRIELEEMAGATQVTQTTTVRLPWRHLWRRARQRRASEARVQRQLEALRRVLETPEAGPGGDPPTGQQAVG